MVTQVIRPWESNFGEKARPSSRFAFSEVMAAEGGGEVMCFAHGVMADIRGDIDGEKLSAVKPNQPASRDAFRYLPRTIVKNRICSAGLF